MSKQIGNIEIKTSKDRILLKERKNMIVIPAKDINNLIETLIDMWHG